MKNKIMIVHDVWASYFTERHGVPMTISFDDAVTEGEPPVELVLCARIIIPILETKPNSTWPVDPESETLYAMEDQLTEALQRSKVVCRLVARMTYDGLRELVFQVGDEDEFRPVVGAFIKKYGSYEIDVSEHEAWSFFNDFIRPTSEDRRNMAEQRVIENLIENGSDPALAHQLEYCFRGEKPALEKISSNLQGKGYTLLEGQDLSEGMVVLSTSMTLDYHEIRKESEANQALAEEFEGELDGWGASVMRREEDGTD